MEIHPDCIDGFIFRYRRRDLSHTRTHFSCLSDPDTSRKGLSCIRATVVQTSDLISVSYSADLTGPPDKGKYDERYPRNRALPKTSNFPAAVGHAVP